MGMLVGFVLSLCLVLFVIHPLLSIQFGVCCLLLLFAYKAVGGFNFFLILVGLFTLWLIRTFSPQYKAASKEVVERKKELNATLFRVYHPEEYFELQQQAQPKASAATISRVRRIQKQLKEQQKKRVANTLPIAKDFLSKKKKR